MGATVTVKHAVPMHLQDEGGFIFSDVTGACYQVSWLYGTYTVRDYESGNLRGFGTLSDKLMDTIGETYGWHAYSTAKEHFSRKYWGLDFETVMKGM